MVEVPKVEVAEAAVVDLEELDLESSLDSACAGLTSSCFAGLVYSEEVGAAEAGAAGIGFVQDVLEEVVEGIEALVETVADAVAVADVVETAAAAAAAAVETYWGRV